MVSKKCFQQAGRGFAGRSRFCPWVSVLGVRGLVGGTLCEVLSPSILLRQNSKGILARFSRLVEGCHLSKNLANSVMHFFQSQCTWLVN